MIILTKSKSEVEKAHWTLFIWEATANLTIGLDWIEEANVVHFDSIQIAPNQ